MDDIEIIDRIHKVETNTLKAIHKEELARIKEDNKQELEISNMNVQDTTENTIQDNSTESYRWKIGSIIAIVGLAASLILTIIYIIMILH